jgi:hypothetical protein
MEASSFKNGADAAKPASPSVGDIWLATDTGYLYVCNSAGSWEKVTKLYLPLAGGVMSGLIGMNNYKIVDLGLGSDAKDAASVAYVGLHAIEPKSTQYDVTASRAIGTVYRNTTGYILMVNVTVNVGIGVYSYAYVEAGDTTPDIPVSQFYHDGAAYNIITHSFMVGQLDYYEVVGGTLSQWIERRIGY